MTRFLCRFRGKRTFSTRADAESGAVAIQLRVEREGGRYDQLYPYLCPDAQHWHLTHYRQGTAVCPVCGVEGPAWDGGVDWMMNTHDVDGVQCPGTGRRSRTPAPNTCRFRRKSRYRSSVDAQRRADDLNRLPSPDARWWVVQECPDADHWHLLQTVAGAIR